MTILADRIRGVLEAGRPAHREIPPESALRPAGAVDDLDHVLGGEWRQLGDSRCFVVEHRRSPSEAHGDEVIGALASRLEEGADVAQLMGVPVAPPFVFFDLETTGLSGGAGTQAFLVGCGWFGRDRSFVTRQYMLVRFSDEVPMLAAVAGELLRAGAVVSFNGKSFDAPLLESRYLYHRLDWVGADVPHLDMLHVARRFWGQQSQLDRGAGLQPRDRSPEGLRHVEPAPPDAAHCSLIALERRILGARRHGDVPGFEIPSRYFHFLRTGDAHPLASVFEHNRLDLLSLASLTSRAVNLVRVGPAQVRHPREALALGRIYARAGLEARACHAYERAVDLSRAGSATLDLHVEALCALARTSRRAHRHEEVARCWRQVLDVRGCPPRAAREASEALAIHHEHRVRDFATATTFALRGAQQSAHPAWSQAARYRLARLQRKMERARAEADGLTFGESSDESRET